MSLYNKEQEQLFYDEVWPHVLSHTLSLVGFFTDASGARCPLACSGFPLRYSSNLFFATAGHCLKGIKKIVKDRGTGSIDLSLVGYTKSTQIEYHIRPFHWDESRSIIVTDKHVEQLILPDLNDKLLDFGLVCLPRNDQISSLINESKVIPLEIVDNPPSWDEFDFFMFSGFPKEKVKKISEHDLIVEPTAVIVHIQSNCGPNLFAGHISDSDANALIVGMSGSIIMGCKREGGHLKFGPVAVQSMQQCTNGFPNKYIFGSPVKFILEYLKDNPSEFASVVRKE